MNRSVLLVLGLLALSSVATAQEYDFRKQDCRGSQFWLAVMQDMNREPALRNESLQVIDIRAPQLVSAQRNRLVCKAVLIFSDLDEIPMKVSLYVGHLGQPIIEWEPLE
jgi:hypothetical protein